MIFKNKTKEEKKLVECSVQEEMECTYMYFTGGGEGGVGVAGV